MQHIKIKDKTEKYKIIKKSVLNTGSSSCVYLGTINKHVCVIKSYFAKESLEFIREKEILKKLKHPNIISPMYLSNKTIAVKLHGRNLRELMKANEISRDDLFDMIIQILDGIKYIHSNKIVHFDLKPENILVDNGLVKIIDFGSAKYFQETISQFNFTNSYSSLEFLLGYKKAHYCQDIWSFGCIIYELLTGEQLISANSTVQAVMQILQIFGSPDQEAFMKLDLTHLDFFNIFNINQTKFNEKFSIFTDNWKGLFSKIFNMDPMLRISSNNIEFKEEWIELDKKECKFEGKELNQVF